MTQSLGAVQENGFRVAIRRAAGYESFLYNYCTIDTETDIVEGPIDDSANESDHAMIRLPPDMPSRNQSGTIVVPSLIDLPQ